jgi:uncharacterized protein (TIRG00374 family)
MATKQASRLKSRLTLILKIAVAVGLIWFLVQSGRLDPKDLWRLMTVQNVVLVLALTGLNLFVSAWRWVILLEGRGIKVSLSYGFSLYLIGTFFNFALPGSVGGDVVRGYYLVADHPGKRLESILSIFIDRILGLYSFFILTLVAVVWDFEFVGVHEHIRWVALLAFLIFVAMTLFFVIIFSHRLSHLFGLKFFEHRLPLVHKLVTGFLLFGRDRKTIIYSILVSFLAQLISMALFYQIGLISGETDLTLKAILFVVPMGFLVTALPIAPAGIGVGQVAFNYLFQAYLQKPTSFGATAVTAIQLSSVCWAMVGAVLYLRRRKPHDLEEIEAIEQAPT